MHSGILLVTRQLTGSGVFVLVITMPLALKHAAPTIANGRTNCGSDNVWPARYEVMHPASRLNPLRIRVLLPGSEQPTVLCRQDLRPESGAQITVAC